MSKNTKVIKCKCSSEFQDQVYGTGNRLHTLSEDGKKAYCTVHEGSSKYMKRNDLSRKNYGKTLA